MAFNVCSVAAEFRENRKTDADAKAKGLMCWPGGRCMSPADYAAEEASNARESAAQARKDAMFSRDSSLSIEARARAAALIAKARAAGTYPKRREGELE